MRRWRDGGFGAVIALEFGRRVAVKASCSYPVELILCPPFNPCMKEKCHELAVRRVVLPALC